jgi:hypothetical protein
MQHDFGGFFFSNAMVVAIRVILYISKIEKELTVARAA